jgi:hypothetical protein
MAGRYRALLIGNSTYPADEHNLQTLKGPVKDITVLNRALADQGTGLFADVDVTLLPEATSTRAVRALGAFFTKAYRDDVLLLYWARRRWSVTAPSLERYSKLVHRAIAGSPS